VIEYKIVRTRSGMYHLHRDGNDISVSFTYLGSRFSLWWDKHIRPRMDQRSKRRSCTVHKETW
jgi:hypothetical protein